MLLPIKLGNHVQYFFERKLSALVGIIQVKGKHIYKTIVVIMLDLNILKIIARYYLPKEAGPMVQ